MTEKKLCFVCNSKRICDKNSYRQGGLGRCKEEKAAERLLNRKEEYLKDKDGKHFAAANRLQMIISGECHHIFAADVYYHNSCYLKFAVNPIIQQVENERNQENTFDILKDFFCKIKIKIIREKNGYLLTDLLEDLKNMSEENGTDSVVSHTSTLKKSWLKNSQKNSASTP